MSEDILTPEDNEVALEVATTFSKVLDWHYSKAVTDSTIQAMQEDVMAYGQAMFKFGFLTAQHANRACQEAAKKAQEDVCSN